MRDREYQYNLEDKILELCDYRELWDNISQYFSADTMINFLEDFADVRDIDLDEDEED